MASKLKSTRSKMLVLLFCVTMCIGALFVTTTSCQSYAKTDGTTGVRLAISDSTHEAIATAGDTATGVLGALSALFPALGAIATAAGTGTLVWRRMKKDVTKYRSPMEMYVKVLEHIKVTDQETWDKVKAEIKLQYPTIDIEATVREIKSELNRLKELPNGESVVAATGTVTTTTVS